MGELLRFGQKISKSSIEREFNWKSLAKAVLLITFILGILLANFMGREKTAGAGVLNDYFIEKFKYGSINKENLFFYIMGERMPFAILLLLLAFSSLGLAIGILNLGWQGFTIGFMLSAAIGKYGANGILLVLAGLFPHYIFYLIVYTGYCSITIFLRQRLSMCVKTGSVSREQIRLYGIGVLLGLLLLFVFITGIFLESYLNPLILKNILKIF